MSFFAEVPVESDEAVLVDGCSRAGAFVRVVLPLSAPGLAAAAIICFIFVDIQGGERGIHRGLERRQVRLASKIGSGLGSPCSMRPAGEDAGARAAPRAHCDEGCRGRQTAPREGTKQALPISMLQRPDGATVEEVVEATGWQKHTVRGAISGALKK